MEAQVGPVLVASGDQEILDVLKSYGATGILTDPQLPSGTDRVKAVVDLYDPPALVADVLDPFKNPAVDIATLATPIVDSAELLDPNVVKIALSLEKGESIGRALYFSRNPIPSGGVGPYYHHIGLYAYRRKSLERFVSLPVNALERIEKLEQLRALADGMRIDVHVMTTKAPFGVDTPADLEKAREVMNAIKATQG